MVDLDQDGLLDVITGSYPGEIYRFPGRPDGTFGAPQRIVDAAGADLNLGRASAVHAADWDADGDLDLVVGDIRGHVWWVANGSGGDGLAFAPGVRLRAGDDDVEIGVPQGDAGPTLADWDGNGTVDLVVGCGDGCVLWFPNEAAGSPPRLGQPIPLLASRGGMRLEEGEPVRPGARAKPCVADWDGDGLLDLLVGDVILVPAPRPTLSPEDADRLERLRARLAWIRERHGPAFERVRLAALADVVDVPGGTPFGALWESLSEEQRTAFSEALVRRSEGDVRSRALSRMLQETSAELATLEPRPTIHGHVWVLRREAPAPAPPTPAGADPAGR